MAKVELNKHAPEFTSLDLNGTSVSLSNFTDRKNVLLVLNRSFSWPFSRRHLAQLCQDYQDFVQLNTEIIVVGSEEAEHFQKYWQKEHLPFIGLPDPDHVIQKLYGQEVKPFKLGRMPAQVLINKSGMILYAHYGDSMADIPSNVEIMNLIKWIIFTRSPALRTKKSICNLFALSGTCKKNSHDSPATKNAWTPCPGRRPDRFFCRPGSRGRRCLLRVWKFFRQGQSEEFFDNRSCRHGRLRSPAS